MIIPPLPISFILSIHVGKTGPSEQRGQVQQSLLSAGVASKAAPLRRE